MVFPERFYAITVEYRVPDFKAGVEFYSKLIGRRPNFEPHIDFVEWDFDNFTLQLAEGEPKPAPPVRFKVHDMESECRRIERELGVKPSSVVRIEGLVMFCNFRDPSGNNLGLYQTIFEHGVPRVPGGSFHDFDVQSEMVEDRRHAESKIRRAQPSN